MNKADEKLHQVGAGAPKPGVPPGVFRGSNLGHLGSKIEALGGQADNYNFHRSRLGTYYAVPKTSSFEAAYPGRKAPPTFIPTAQSLNHRSLIPGGSKYFKEPKKKKGRK